MLLSRQFLFWILIGILGGGLSTAYWLILEFLVEHSAAIAGWWVVPLMAGAGLLAGLVIYFIGDPGEIELIVNNIRFRGGRLDSRNNPSMFLSSMLCIGAGGSLGPEAPLVQITGSTGTWLARKFKLKRENTRALTIAGMAAGFTALFGAPLGASFFALEVLHHKHIVEYYEALLPTFISSCTAYLVFLYFTGMGYGPIWVLPVYHYGNIGDFFLAIGFGLVGAAAGWVFIFVFRSLKAGFRATRWPIYVSTTVGGILLGLIAVHFPLVRFFGHHELSELLDTRFTVGMLALLFAAKVVATGITGASGWRGGFIIPLFFSGACLGLLVSQTFFPEYQALAVVCCMAAINSCVTRTPLSTILLLSSLTGFGGFLPIMFSSLTGFFLAPRIPFISAQFHED